MSDLDDELALALYVQDSLGVSTPEASRRRWVQMPPCGRRPFVELANVARADATGCAACRRASMARARLCMACAELAADAAEVTV